MTTKGTVQPVGSLTTVKGWVRAKPDGNRAERRAWAKQQRRKGQPGDLEVISRISTRKQP